MGVDFGTTRTVVAAVDRGNYPVVAFADDHGDMVDHIPSVVARGEHGLLHGHAAIAAARADERPLRSMKRLLGASDLGPDSAVWIGGHRYRLLEVLTDHLRAVREALLTTSTISADLDPDTPLVATVAVPAHAHGPQRFWTLEAFRSAGFEVLGMLNEPSAAAFEYTHRQPRTLNSRRTRVVVYDLGGGTFDASVVDVDGTDHQVVGSIGLDHLGGDDFDEILAELAAATTGTELGALPPAARSTLLDDAREAKERLTPQSRRIVLDVGAETTVIPVADFYELSEDLVQSTVAVMEPLVADLIDDPGSSDIAGIYLTGGATSLPLVPRVLRQHFGRRVHRSPAPAASTAIGLAIAADPDSTYHLRDQLSRGFGVFRDTEEGRAVGLDEIFDPQRMLCAGAVTRTYRAAHTIGWFRFVEYRHDRIATHDPSADLVPFGDLVMPFEASDESRSAEELRALPVERRWPDGDGPRIEERYLTDGAGLVHVTMTNLDTGHQRSVQLGHGNAPGHCTSDSGA